MLLQATFFVGCMAIVLAVCFKSEPSLWYRCVHVSPPLPSRPLPHSPIYQRQLLCLVRPVGTLSQPSVSVQGSRVLLRVDTISAWGWKIHFCVWNDKFLLLCGSFGFVCPMLLTMCLKVLIHLLTNFFLLHRQICVVNSGTKWEENVVWFKKKVLLIMLRFENCARKCAVYGGVTLC